MLEVALFALTMFVLAWLWPRRTCRFRGSVAGFEANLLAETTDVGQLQLGTQKHTVFSYQLVPQPRSRIVLLSVQPTTGVAWVGVLSGGRLHPFRLDGRL